MAAADRLHQLTMRDVGSMQQRLDAILAQNSSEEEIAVKTENAVEA
jgi:hypothetical protein